MINAYDTVFVYGLFIHSFLELDLYIDIMEGIMVSKTCPKG